MTKLVFKVLDHKLVVSHVCDQSNECKCVHGVGGFVLVPDVEGEEAVDKEVGGVHDVFVGVRDPG